MLRRSLLALGLLALSTLGFAGERFRDIVYQKHDGVDLTMDVFKPEKPNGVGVVFIVSGGWNSRRESISPEVARPLTDKGITVFEVLHDNQPHALVPEIVREVQHAVRFIRANASNYGVDPNRLGIFGASSGGHLALMVAGTGDAGNPQASDPVDRVSSAVQAVGAYFPPTDFANFGKAGQSAFDIPMLAVFYPAFGITKDTPRDQISKLIDTLSPIKFVTEKYPPTYIVQGDKDAVVPMQQAQSFSAALSASKVPNTVVIVPGAGHNPLLLISPDATKLADWFVATLNK